MKSIPDVIYGRIRLTPLQEDLLNNPIVQRLSHIKQLGLVYLVYPNAVHTRLSHSLGVSHLARKIGERLGLDQSLINLLTAAGLLHDIGHGPFSHFSETVMNELNENHMDFAAKLITGQLKLTNMKEKNTIPEILHSHGINPKDGADIVNKKYKNEKYPFLQDIIFGSIDADILDYLMRDAYFTDPKISGVDIDRIIEVFTVKSNKFCMFEKGMGSIISVFLTRNLMYKRVYLHHTVRIAEKMLQQSVRNALGELKEFKEMVDGELMANLLKSKNHTARKLASMVFSRNLLKRAYSIKDTELNGKTLALFEKLRKIGEDKIESFVSKKIGLKKDYVLIDLPIQNVNMTEPRLKDYDFDILLRRGQIAKFSDLQPATVKGYALESSLPEYVFLLFVPKEYKDKANKAMKQFIKKLK